MSETRRTHDLSDLSFRTLAAPGLDEDDLFAAMYGLPGEGVLWGDGAPVAFAPVDPAWDEARERQRRHEEILGRWRVDDDLQPPRRDHA